MAIPISKIFLLGSLLSIFIASFFYTKKGIVFSILIGAAFILGAALTKFEYKNVPKELFPQNVFIGKVLKVEEKIEGIALVFRSEGNKIQANYRGHKEIYPGDTIKIQGNIEEIEDFQTDSGRVFKYEKYMKSRGIVATMYDPEIEIVQSGGLNINRFATHVRNKITGVLSDKIDFPINGVIGGMLIGSKGSIPEEAEDLFRETGVLHVLVLSGYNITILAGLLGIALKGVSMKIKMVLIGFAIFSIVLISGAGIAAIRAGVMGSIALLASSLLRVYDPLRAIFIAYLIFFLISPLIILYDPGFHLSFLATIFMVKFMKKISSFFSFIPTENFMNIKEIFLLSIFMPFFMLPYTAFFSGLFSFAAIPANVLFAIVGPVFMLLGGLTLFPISISKVFAVLVSYVGGKVFWVLEFLSGLKSIHTPIISGWSVLLFYIVLTFIFFRKDIMRYAQRLRTSFELPSNSSD